LSTFPGWLIQEIDRRGIGQNRLFFAGDRPWGDHTGEFTRLQAAAGDGELGRMVLRDNFHDSLPLIWDASISNLSSP
jgi:uncharacterized protein